MQDKNTDNILDISKRRGIVYPSFEIYGGVSGFYDYGPIGTRIKKNVDDLIREYYVIGEGCVEVECPTVSPEQVWVASGHVKNFSDMTTECLKCGQPYRADHLIEEDLKISCDGMKIPELQKLIDDNNIACPKCRGKLDKLYDYNLMFATSVGAGKGAMTAYLRPETAQTTYLAFNRLWEITRRKIPFGVLQIGKSFRNEISPRQGMLRLREFSQAEVQFFAEPENKTMENFGDVAGISVRILSKDEKEISTTIGAAFEDKIIKIQMIAYFLGRSVQLFGDMGINTEKLRLRQHKDDERAFYSSETWDIEFMSGAFGRIEIVGISDRGDYDLSAHQKLSKQSMEVNIEGRKFIPHVVEVAYGIDRPIYCVLESCLREDERGAYFAFPTRVAPYKAAVFPLVKKDGLDERALEVFRLLRKSGVYAIFDRSGSIGKRYARADEVGIPYCLTVDYDTLTDGTVTVRSRDSKEQKRVKIEEIVRQLD
ncbi:MAG: glycine--tRNA ligase [Candidatus Altiarchaeales archaeon IMC4]|nr:MAG: glycine--tRNA ligase [Candidatus Altiarchaeales archaeon IMC4]